VHPANVKAIPWKAAEYGRSVQWVRRKRFGSYLGRVERERVPSAYKKPGLRADLNRKREQSNQAQSKSKVPGNQHELASGILASVAGVHQAIEKAWE